jgi:hypothetical protein
MLIHFIFISPAGASAFQRFAPALLTPPVRNDLAKKAKERPLKYPLVSDCAIDPDHLKRPHDLYCVHSDFKGYL